MDYSHIFGSTFGELTVIGQTGSKDRLECKCSCGNSKIAQLRHLRAGTVKSCGCLLIRRPKEVHGTYLASRTAEYKAWDGMIRRCLSPSHYAFRHYGGRGIQVCAQWLGSKGFGVFLRDMGPKPDGTSLDRIDNNLGYSPDNCRWASALTQSNNRRTNVFLFSRGETHSIKEWSRIVGIGRTTIDARLKSGWSTEKALHTPVRMRAK